MTRPILLDLFCNAGGAAKGYQRAGFYVVGVDIEPQPNYCGDEFQQLDALEVLQWIVDPVNASGLYLEGDFDAIHASPPCQGYVQWNNLNAERYGSRVNHPTLIDPVREALRAIGVPYVIENVVGAPLHTHLMLCGSMFGLGVRRHRNFETNMLIPGPPPCAHTGDEIAVYGWLDGRRIWTRADGSGVRAAKTLEQAQEAMGIDWMDWDHLKEAIPPAYTEWIGRQLIDQMEVAA